MLPSWCGRRDPAPLENGLHHMNNVEIPTVNVCHTLLRIGSTAQVLRRTKTYIKDYMQCMYSSNQTVCDVLWVARLKTQPVNLKPQSCLPKKEKPELAALLPPLHCGRSRHTLGGYIRLLDPHCGDWSAFLSQNQEVNYTCRTTSCVCWSQFKI